MTPPSAEYRRPERLRKPITHAAIARNDKTAAAAPAVLRADPPHKDARPTRRPTTGFQQRPGQTAGREALALDVSAKPGKGAVRVSVSGQKPRAPRQSRHLRSTMAAISRSESS